MRIRQEQGDVTPATVNGKSSSKTKMPRGITRLESISIESLRLGTFSARGDLAAKDRTIPELADSIAASGIIEPIVVRHAEIGVFEVVAGERRLAAARLLKLRHVPCVVKECTESEALMISLTENLQRRDLSPVEKAHGLRRLQEDCQLTQEEIGKQVGMSQSAIAHYLRLLDLPGEVRALIHEGELSMGHGKVLAGMADKRQVVELALDCVSKNRSVRNLEMSLSNLSLPERGRRYRGASTRRREEVELPNGLFVVIKGSPSDQNCGTIEIPYWSEQEKEWAITVLAKAGSSSVVKATAHPMRAGAASNGRNREADISRLNGGRIASQSRHRGPYSVTSQANELKRAP